MELQCSEHKEKKKKLRPHTKNINEAKETEMSSVNLSAVEHGTSVMSRDAAAALMCKLGCLTELLQSNARAKVPTALRTH